MDFMYLWGLGSEPPALGQEDPLEKGMATLSSILARRIPWTEEPGGLLSMRSQRVGHNWVSNTLTFILQRKKQLICHNSFIWQKVKVKSLSRIRLFATPWTVAYQAPPSMGFSRQECWSELPFLSPGELPDPGIEPESPALQADALPSELPEHF